MAAPVSVGEPRARLRAYPSLAVETAPTSRAPSQHAWQVILAIGCACVVGYFFLPGEKATDLSYSAIGVAATIAMVWAIRRQRPAERGGWYLLAIANACFVVGDGVYTVYDLVLHRATPFPSIADAVYLAGYPNLFVGVARVSRLRAAPGAREARADAAMVSLGGLALSWQLLMTSYAHDGTLSLAGRLVTLAYPVMDVGVLFIVASAVLVRSARRPTETLLALAVSIMVGADFGYDLLVLHGAYRSGDPIDCAFLLNYVLMAAAAAHPSVRRAASTDEPTSHRAWGPLVAAASFVSPAIVVVCRLVGAAVDAGALAATSIALSSLAVLRASWLFRRLRAQTLELEEHGKRLQGALAGKRELEGDLRHQALHDSLTGLANRALLFDRIEHALQSAARNNDLVALCLCDLDGFKEVNDTLGHEVGDELLVVATKRLCSVVRAGDTVARLGGDEFAVLLQDAADIDTVTALAERILSVLREPARVGDRLNSITASVGVALAGPHTTRALLLSEADAAMYEAKAGGRDRLAVFQTVMRSRMVERMSLSTSFAGSLQRGEYVLEYQPQIRLSDGCLQGFESLVRWNHPELGLIGPVRFVPIAEETGFIIPLGRWILEQACREAAGWDDVAGAALSVSVNLSGRQLQDSHLLQDVRTALSRSGLDPRRLVLEITESVLIQDRVTIAEVLRECRALGIRVAIDDFGTGYSSLSYLRQFPIDILKIDKSFVDPLRDPANQGDAIVHTILRLAAELQLEATAEGIEYPIQRDTLSRLNCHSAQGYLWSRPLGADAARRYLATFAPAALG